MAAIPRDGVDQQVFAVPDMRITAFAIRQMANGMSSGFDGPLTEEEVAATYVDLALK